MQFILQITVIAIIGIILWKVTKGASGITRIGYSVYSKVIVPIKWFLLWEYGVLSVVTKNLWYTKDDVFGSLSAKHMVGVLRPENIATQKNPIVLSILLIALQAKLLELFLCKNELGLTYQFDGLCWALTAIIIGCILGAMISWFNKESVGKAANCFHTSTLGDIVNSISVKMLNRVEVFSILAHLKCTSSLEIANMVKEGKTNYPMLTQYLQDLELNTKTIPASDTHNWVTKILQLILPSVVLRRVIRYKRNDLAYYTYQAIIELISYMHSNISVRASVVKLGHGGISVLEHSLNVAEYALGLFKNKVFAEHVHLQDFAVLTCLSHDIGKIKCHLDGQANFNGHERQSYQILGLFELFARVGDYNPHLKDTVTTAILRQKELIVNDENEDLVRINHIFKAADESASKDEGRLMTHEHINEIYRTAFYILLANKDSMVKCASLVNGFLFLDVQKFVRELIKFTGQTFSVDNYANTEVFKQIKNFMLHDGLLQKEHSEICSIVMTNTQTGKEIKRIQHCLILKMDLIFDNANIKLDNVEVNAQVNNNIVAKLLFKSGGIKFVKPSVAFDDGSDLADVVETKEIERIDNADNSNLDIAVVPKASITMDSAKQTNDDTYVTSPNLSINEYDYERQVQMPKGSGVGWSLSDVNDYFLNSLQAVGIKIQQIPWGRKNVTYEVRTEVGARATITAYIDGKILVYYSIYEAIDFANHEAKTGTLKLPYGKSWVNATLEYYLTHVKWNDSNVVNTDIAFVKRLNLDYEINDYIKYGIHDDKLMVAVNNLVNEDIYGVVRCYIENDNAIEEKVAIIADGTNYIPIGGGSNFGIIPCIYLVDNIADALVLFSITKITVLVYFNINRTIEKITEMYPDKEIRLFVNFDNYEEILAAANKYNIKPYCYSTNDDKHLEELISTFMLKHTRLPRLSELYASCSAEDIVKIREQLYSVFIAQESFDLVMGIDHAAETYVSYRAKLTAL